MPVFSNVEEPPQVKPLQQRKNQMVVFGTPVRREEVYTKHFETLIHACRSLNVEMIVDIGRSMKSKFSFPLPFIELGNQSAEKISSILSDSRAGFLSYFDGYLAKSGIFAAYCAHGLLPVMPARNVSELDGIRAGKEYVTPLDISRNELGTAPQTIADNARLWYNEHSLTKAAAILAAALCQSSDKLDVKIPLD